MIYILSGNDTKKKNAYLKKLCKDNAPMFLSNKEITKNTMLDYAHSVSLFGEVQIVVFEGLIKEESFALSDEELAVLKESPTVFVFMEEKLLVPQVKKYKKYAIIEDFSMTVLKQNPRMNMFDIADGFSRRDKVNTWMLYREAVSLGVQPEEISGILFWKIKTMLLSGTKLFSSDELKKRSSELVSIYHRAHRGECDFVVGLEQFILSSLNKK